MRDRLVLALMVTACFLYTSSLFLPAAGEGDPATGFEILLFVSTPYSWFLIVPLWYFVVNLTFLFSVVLIWRRRRGRLYSFLVVFSACSAWCAWMFFSAVGPGYFAWCISVTLAAAAFLVSVKESAASVSSDFEFQDE